MYCLLFPPALVINLFANLTRDYFSPQCYFNCKSPHIFPIRRVCAVEIWEHSISAVETGAAAFIPEGCEGININLHCALAELLYYTCLYYTACTVYSYSPVQDVTRSPGVVLAPPFSPHVYPVTIIVHCQRSSIIVTKRELALVNPLCHLLSLP